MSGLFPKRSREEDEVPLDSLKRFHGETEREILHLVEDIEPVDNNRGEEKGVISEDVVNGVMRSLEEEIGLTSCSTSYGGPLGFERDNSVQVSMTSRYEKPVGDNGEIDLSCLLGASDDELGISPCPLLKLEDGSLSSSPEEERFGLSLNFAENAELKGSVENWHFEDDFIDYSQFPVLEDPVARDVASQSTFTDGCCVLHHINLI